ncbi:SDR family NAD(P)-dependent oxidoreductase [Bacillus changyiensis]|uniref:SDR family NAD(P)-dependent oxidoreductase n=1 Tax=Bacillus changyiensis TaxID=3004103 RepID=UPI0022E0EAAB|nr:SDR family NAD(P)-dependent oxidoreductase [Bacillus changyiensis]MDA1476796.1 SDR family NAD(P)-dependent oxidoreductase [Bacillus changyiensis]
MSDSLTIIVGSGAELGLKIAEKFGRNGFSIVLVSRNKNVLEQHVSLLRKKRIKADLVTADVTNSTSVKTAFKQIQERYGEPSVVIYNAVVRRKKTPSKLTEEELMNDFKVNVIGAKTVATEVIPFFIKKRRGTILFTGGGHALKPSIEFSSMSLCKAALRNLAFSLGEELKTSGVFVGTVTIMKKVEKDTDYDPSLIAEAYWDLHQNRHKPEIIY